MSYPDFLDADRRLCILRLLVEGEGHSNESVLESCLKMLGHYVGLDRAYVREQLRKLEQMGCVTIEYFRDTVMVAHITERGVAVVEGRSRVEGIARPAMGK